MLQQQLLLVDQKLDLAKEAACRRQKLLNQETQQVVKAVAAFPDQQKASGQIAIYFLYKANMYVYMYIQLNNALADMQTEVDRLNLQLLQGTSLLTV